MLVHQMHLDNNVHVLRLLLLCSLNLVLVDTCDVCHVYLLKKLLTRWLVTIIIRSHHSTKYIDAAYCYQPSSVVCRSVCHTSDPAKTAEAIKMPFGLWARMGPRNHVLDY